MYEGDSGKGRAWAGTHLQHVQKGRLSGIVEAEEEELGVLVEQAEGGQDIVDCAEGPSATVFPS